MKGSGRSVKSSERAVFSGGFQSITQGRQMEGDSAPPPVCLRVNCRIARQRRCLSLREAVKTQGKGSVLAEERQ